MSPLAILIILLIVFIGFIVITQTSIKVLMMRKEMKDKEDFKSGKKICIHTKEDCENCMVAAHCVQVNGKGLLSR